MLSKIYKHDFEDLLQALLAMVHGSIPHLGLQLDQSPEILGRYSCQG